MGKGDEKQDPHSLEPEGNEHRVLAADMIGDPAKEWACEPVQDAVQRQREGKGGHGDPEQRNRDRRNLIVRGDRAELRGRHQTAHGEHRHHHVQEPEHRSLQHFERREIPDRLLSPGRRRGGDFVLPGSTQEQGAHHHYEALGKAEIDEGGLVATAIDEVGDRHNGECRARAKGGGREAGGQPPALREPLQRVAHARTVDDPRADPSDEASRVEREEGPRLGVEPPGDSDQDATDGDQPSRAEAIHEVALERHEPGLGQDEQGEGDLNRRFSPVELAVDRVDEERPAILEISDRDHPDNAEHQLHPSGAGRRPTPDGRLGCSFQVLSPSSVGSLTRARTRHAFNDRIVHERAGIRQT